ncbi:hypothetical protein [Glaciibacter flavus]|uniref:hypothetical protein n=1 Tax=Orlajensenia flava TaxID=2565934 RepID=UPI003B0064F3
MSSRISSRLMIVASVVAVGLSIGLTGCSSLSSGGSDDEQTVQDAVVDDEPSGVAIPQPDAPLYWTCSYDPTINDDWHDDVLCSNGVETNRPYLREGDDFITQDEIMESAADFEAQLNARG